MWRYPDGSIKLHAPARIEDDGFIRSFADLTPARRDALGYDEAVPLKREPYTDYETEWVKGEDLVYRETAVGTVVDEAARDAAKAEAVRTERDRLLAESDWTQLADAPLSDGEKAAWAITRQSLRDVPQQAGFPAVVTWPEMPAA